VALTPRPGIEEETDLLNYAAQRIKQAAGVTDGVVDVKEANVLLGIARAAMGISKQSVSNRMVRPRLLAQEAKQIEHQ
jgi:hypothetical protein